MKGENFEVLEVLLGRPLVNTLKTWEHHGDPLGSLKQVGNIL